ncbi:hypothetical protein Daus18300_005090 [Diaporthe australafricana]|uniref:Uncharacterized protein n=1 Tax=Diaporthe australafricana TaxID=127596 RepID=A0ABR3X4L5_9PEZI
MAASRSDTIDQRVDKLIQDWAEKNTIKIVRAYTQKGGWEGWAQVEIATALGESRDSSNYGDARDALKAILYKTSREQPVYRPETRTTRSLLTLKRRTRVVQKRADVVIESQPPLTKEFVIVELKCEGFHNKDNFVEQVKKDIEKVKGDIKDDFKPAKAWAYAISTSEAYKEMSRLPAIRHTDLYSLPQGQPGVKLSPDERAMNPRICLWVFEKHHK